MSSPLAGRATLVVLSALVAVSAARADTPGRARVTIRGTGNAVVIERSEGRAIPGVSRATAVPAGPIAEAIRLKLQGASDSALISFFRAHEAELPPVVDSVDVRQLRSAGAGKGVVLYLATVSAVDIGETGEGHESVIAMAPVSPIDLEASPYGVSDAYLSGGYLSNYPQRLASRAFPRSRRMAVPRGRPVFHPRLAPRVPFPRRPRAR